MTPHNIWATEGLCDLFTHVAVGNLFSVYLENNFEGNFRLYLRWFCLILLSINIYIHVKYLELSISVPGTVGATQKQVITTLNGLINISWVCAIPNLDVFNIAINKESFQDCSTPWKWTIAKLEPNKPLLMRGADRRSKIGIFLW